MSNPRRVIVFGVGGSGSWAADAFARVLGVHAPDSQLILVDGDNFEPKNVSRQNFTRYGNKARSVAADIIEKVDNILCIGMAAWVVSEDQASDAEADEEGVAYKTAESILQEDDIIFVCFDNMQARKLVFEAAEKLNNVDVFNGGNEEDGFGCTYFYSRRDGVDVVSPPRVVHEEFVNPPDKNPGELSCAERAKIVSGTQLISTNMTVATVMCHDAREAIFADEVDDGKPNGYHRAGVLLAHEKMWNTDTWGFQAYAWMDQNLFDELCEINPDVAEQVHGKSMTIEALSV